MPQQHIPKHRLICIGSLLADDIAKPQKKLHPGASNPVVWEHHLGGVAANVATAAALHCDTALVSAIGHDIDSLLDNPILHKVTPCWIKYQQPNDRYTAVLTAEGDLFVGLASTELTEALSLDDIVPHLASTAACYAVDANLNPRCLDDLSSYLSGLTHNPIIVALPISPEKATKWRSCARYANILFCNRREAAALTDLPNDLKSQHYISSLTGLGFTDIVLTDAANPLTVMQSGELTTIDVPECNIMGTVNGAGDAMAGATLAHYCHNGDLVRSMKEAGIIAARCVLEGTPIRYPAPTTIIHSPLNT